jgi:hypothetical protein
MIRTRCVSKVTRVSRMVRTIRRMIRTELFAKLARSIDALI